jgi:lipopolysaccharide transport system ATP-binding protein
MKPIINVQHLTKRYRVGDFRPGDYSTIRETLSTAFTSAWRRLRPISPSANGKAASPSEHLALDDVSFDVKRGEAVGIIGRNGAGKSTLLKILGRITEPTEGRALLRGRIGSLLEVGTGFHPELTGRENVYLNGSILGMTHKEVERKFDEIVAFAEIDTFLDTPVKRYSSGMYVRLAFAVAAHLDLDILLVDEVLAVGDASYQRRCIDRMADLARSGTTLLFVSHNMDLIRRLCRRAVLLDHGKVALQGPVDQVADRYLKLMGAEGHGKALETAHRTGDGRARFTDVRHVDSAGNDIPTHCSGDDFRVQVEVTAFADIKEVQLAVVLLTLHGTRLISSWTREVNFPVELCKGLQSFECCFRDVRLRPGHRIAVGLWMATQNVMDYVSMAFFVDVVPGATTAHLSTDKEQGILALDYEWTRLPSLSPEQTEQESLLID